MNEWAAPGKQCVCINDNWDISGPLAGWEPSARVPMLNEVLTIKQVFRDHPLKGIIRGGVALTFEELGHDDCFSLHNFAELTAAEPSDPDNLDYGSAYDG